MEEIIVAKKYIFLFFSTFYKMNDLVLGNE
jgi:hypothetical protein